MVVYVVVVVIVLGTIFRTVVMVARFTHYFVLEYRSRA
jgi:hypothetical protein